MYFFSLLSFLATEGSSFEIINESNPLTSRLLIWTVNGYTLTVMEQSYSHELTKNKFKIDFYANILHGGVSFYRDRNRVILSIILINCNILRYVFDIGNFESNKSFFQLTKNKELCDIYASTEINDFLLAEWIDPFHFTIIRQEAGDVLSVEITKDNQIHTNTFSTETHSFLYNKIFGVYLLSFIFINRVKIKKFILLHLKILKISLLF